MLMKCPYLSPALHRHCLLMMREGNYARGPADFKRKQMTISEGKIYCRELVNWMLAKADFGITRQYVMYREAASV